MKLNLGCGFSKISDCINVDINKACNPDVVCDITAPLPFKDNSVDTVYFFHTIEHIKKALHSSVLSQVYRVLKPNGILVVSYPEFRTCYKYWETNYKGLKDFWEATILGRQLNIYDSHAAIMDTPEFVQVLLNIGFEILFTCCEPNEDYNTLLVARKSETVKYDEAIKELICQIT